MTDTAAWEGYREFRIARKVPESETVTSFYLIPADGGPLVSFRPGQFLGFKLRVPDQERPVMRTYTLSDSPARAADGYYRVSIKREPAPVDRPEISPGVSSNFFHDRVAVGTEIKVRAPSGEFFLEDGSDNRPLVLVSGGVGLTPMISMLNDVIDRAGAREIYFVHGVRNSREHAFGDHVRDVARGHDNVTAHICYSRPDAGDVEGRHFDTTGHVTGELLKDLLPGPECDFFLCGAPPFMEAIYAALREWGVPAADIRYEYFGAGEPLENTLPEAASPDVATSAGQTFQVEFKKSGIKAAWDGSEDSLLDLAEAAGADPDSSCRSGICHTCLCTVAEGTFEYVNDDVFTPDGDDEILICSARPTSDIVIDI